MLNAVVQMAAVQLELCLTGAAAGTPAAATAAALAAQGFAQPLPARQGNGVPSNLRSVTSWS